MSHWTHYLTQLSSVESVLLKTVLILVFGWFVHFVALRANPRWRILVWRGVLLGLLTLPLSDRFLPEIGVPLATPSVSARPVVNAILLVEGADSTRAIDPAASTVGVVSGSLAGGPRAGSEVSPRHSADGPTICRALCRGR